MFNPNTDMGKNLKDTNKNSLKDMSSTSTQFPNPQKDHRPFYGKTDKLITALYMVTDIMDKDEPIRHKLRALGIEILSDMHSANADLGEKITQTISFLNVASAMSFISEMNCGILKKEFLELGRLINENREIKPVWLDEFFATPNGNLPNDSETGLSFSPTAKKIHGGFKGHTRIGVQKGSTLLQALSDRTRLLQGNNYLSESANQTGVKHSVGIVKNDRRNEILNVLKNNNGSATIKDILTKISGNTLGGLSYSEKTLQRELMSMIKDGVLYKAGEKRWSRYFLKG